MALTKKVDELWSLEIQLLELPLSGVDMTPLLRFPQPVLSQPRPPTTTPSHSHAHHSHTLH